jgi:hypothetical protein
MKLPITCRLLAVIAGLAVLAPSPAAAQQALASALSAPAATAAFAEKAGCWGCQSVSMVTYCVGGVVPGYWNCVTTWYGCSTSSPGCGEGAALPVDADGSTQYVSRAPGASVLVAATPDTPGIVANCEGIVVARRQSGTEIASVRRRSASLTL